MNSVTIFLSLTSYTFCSFILQSLTTLFVHFVVSYLNSWPLYSLASFRLNFSACSSLFTALPFAAPLNSGHFVVSPFFSYQLKEGFFLFMWSLVLLLCSLDNFCDHIRAVVLEGVFNRRHLLQCLSFYGGFGLGLMYLSYIESVRSSLIHVHSFH